MPESGSTRALQCTLWEPLKGLRGTFPTVTAPQTSLTLPFWKFWKVPWYSIACSATAGVQAMGEGQPGGLGEVKKSLFHFLPHGLPRLQCFSLDQFQLFRWHKSKEIPGGGCWLERGVRGHVLLPPQSHRNLLMMVSPCLNYPITNILTTLSAAGGLLPFVLAAMPAKWWSCFPAIGPGLKLMDHEIY